MECRLATPFRRDLLIEGNGLAITGSRFVPFRRAAQAKPSDALLAEAAAQVRAYFARRLRRFDLPLELEGTLFRVAVWRAVAALEFGQFVSYADVARAIGRPLAHRGVAAAMSARATRPLHSRASSDRRRRTHQGRAGRLIAREARRLRTTARLGRLHHVIGVRNRLLQKPRLVGDDVVDKRKLRVAAVRTEVIAAVAAFENLPSRH